MRTQSTIEPAIGEIADAQYGVVARAQLLSLGLVADAIGRRVRCGRLRLLHRGVYAVGHLALRREAHWLAAVLACGDGAALSHVAAAAHWGLRPSAAARVDVTVRGGGGRKRPGLCVHRHALRPGEITTREAIPVTTPARTLLDLAASLPRRALLAAGGVRVLRFTHRQLTATPEDVARALQPPRSISSIR